MVSSKKFLASVALWMSITLPSSLRAQDLAQSAMPPAYHATPVHMWEVGLHGGTAFTFGDIDFVPNWGAGFHVRRAIDYVFSLRADGLYSKLKNEDAEDGAAETTLQSGSVQLLVSVNSLIWSNAPRRKMNFYGLLGGGATRFEVDAKKIILPDLKSRKPVIQTHADFGIGMAFRVSERFNLGIESKGLVVFGNNADLLDGVSRREKDVVSYTSVRLNFNIGNTEKRSEPLYWVNPMDVIIQDVTELKNRPVFDLTDSDGDGVIDLLDQDNTTPPGAPVDTRGILLDSDGDGIPNYQDDEPYVPAGLKYVIEGEYPFMKEGDVRDIIDDELSMREDAGLLGDGLVNWFLPMVHFNVDSDKIRYAEYGNLASIARVMKNHPNLRVVVTGFADKTFSDTYNFDLSYRRAKAALEHLVVIHGIPRSRLILNFNGEDLPLAPLAGSNMMNRRVEFRVANKEDIDMENPVPVSKREKKDGY